MNGQLFNALRQQLADLYNRFTPLPDYPDIHTDGEWTLEQAADMIRQNSRHYAKRQLTWFRADPDIHWLELTDTPQDLTTIMQIIQNEN